MRVGIYFYPWYGPKRWRETARLLTPEKGEYDSADAEVGRWQADHLARCGFDYVIFELVPVTDWGFEASDRAIAAMIPFLRERHLRWSFLMDAYVAADPTAALPEMKALVRHVEKSGWDDGLVTGPTGRPCCCASSPYPRSPAPSPATIPTTSSATRLTSRNGTIPTPTSSSST